MSFRAIHDGSIVVPASVSNQESVQCPDCGGAMYARGGEKLARHFYHIDSEAEESCSQTRTGESETHARCVALAVATLEEKFGDQASYYGPEVTIDVHSTATVPDQRRADALLEFEGKNPYFGQGLIIEVQHKHYSKDIEATTHDYLSAGYSVAWISSNKFDEENLEYSVVEEAFRSEAGEGYSVRDHDPWEFETRVGTDLQWEKPRIDCFSYVEYGEHAWSEIPAYVHPNGYSYEICKWCSLRRRYDNELTRFVYDYEGVLAPGIEPEVLCDAIVLHIDGCQEFEEWIDSDLHGGPAAFEKAVAGARTEVEPCRGPNKIHEWGEPDVLETRYGDVPEVELYECRYCPVHLIANYRNMDPDQSYILFGDEPESDWNLTDLGKNPWRCEYVVHQEGVDAEYCRRCGVNDP